MDNFFDPPSASPNLPEDDPLRQWAMDIQRDPELHKLMATDPQAAARRMADMGIPPPPGNLQAYTDGQDASNSVPPIAPYRTARSGPGIIGGAEPPPTPGSNFDPSQMANAGGEQFPVFKGGKLQGNLTSAQGTPPATNPPLPDQKIPPATTTVASADTGSYFDPPILDPEPNPSAGQPLVPKERPVSTDLSSKNKTADGLDSFSKSLQGVRPIPPAPPNFVGTPAAPHHTAITAPNLQHLLSLVGQPGPSPLGLTLGRLLATGKA